MSYNVSSIREAFLFFELHYWGSPIIDSSLPWFSPYQLLAFAAITLFQITLWTQNMWTTLFSFAPARTGRYPIWHIERVCSFEWIFWLCTLVDDCVGTQCMNPVCWFDCKQFESGKNYQCTVRVSDIDSMQRGFFITTSYSLSKLQWGTTIRSTNDGLA